MVMRHTTHRGHVAAVLLGTTLALAVQTTTAAQTAVEGSDSDAWQFEITPYVLGAGLNGTVGIGSVTANVDMSFSDLLENLDSGFMALFEARKGRWTFAVDGIYFKLEGEGTKSWQGPLGNTGTGSLEATVTEQLYQLTAGYRVLDERTKVDVLGAARYTQLDTKLNT
jgi:hypothetical protein